jgi:hypothetical protein
VPPQAACATRGPPYSEVTEVNCRVPSTSFSQAPRYALPVHLCRFRVRSSMQGLFPGTSSTPIQSDKDERLKRSVTTCWLTNINVIPIDYAFRPRLRDRLTLRRLTLRRNPWTFGDTVFHSVCRYSCQHSHFRCLQEPSRVSLRQPTERSATVSGGQKTDDGNRMTSRPRGQSLQLS